MNTILQKDLDRIFYGLSEDERLQFQGSTILLTGCAGFLGFYFVHFFSHFAAELNIQKIIGLDNFKIGYPNWLKKISNEGKIELHEFDIISDDIEKVPGAEQATYIYHMASIASPTFYRKFPIETLDANIWGLRKLLDFYCSKPISNLVFFSSSEIYGDPSPEYIPTSEDYRGNVSSMGPRACYDESKRFGETMCYLYNEQFQMPITIIRPFNNYGPGMRLNDKRVPADFAKAIVENRDIVMYSDGTPTRTFCYVTDAITGYLKGLVYQPFDVFNIGIDSPEISVRQLAGIYQEAGQEVFGYKGNLIFETNDEKEYLTNNPNRRCPNIDKAKQLLNYEPQIQVYEGVRLFLQYLKECESGDMEW